MKRLHIGGITAMACAAFVLRAAVDGSFVLGAAQPLNLGAGEKADDAVRHAILSGSPVPRDIGAIRRRLQTDLGGVLKTHIVANGGHEHPSKRGVMFMCFETYAGPMPGGRVDEGDLFLGYFLVPQGGRLGVGSGFVELIAWDRTKRRFNFWELIDSTWQFRGDSNDVLDNVREINTGSPKAEFKFSRTSPDGTTVLRCSGCHTLGGPIMKELEAPHNDWWTDQHKLPPGAFVPDQETAKLFQGATDASNLSAQVKKSVERLVDARSEGGVDRQTLSQQLRSLFSTMEMNLVSDTVPFSLRQERGTAVEVPAGFFVDARLARAAPTVPVDLATYKEALTGVDSRFPSEQSPTRETRHAFLVPARSFIDNRAIDSLVKRGVLDDELVADVLAVDLTTPVYSSQRASLIRFVPATAADASELRERLITALRAAPASDRGAQDLLANLTDAARTAAAHRAAASAFLAACTKAAGAQETVPGWLRLAAQRREAIESAETARHPQGVITERGFRVVFPIQRRPAATPLRLNPTTCLVEPRTSS
jgi:hypothetical protein